MSARRGLDAHRGRSLAGALAVGMAAVLLLAGCERPQVINYKQGKYQGKPDTPAWQSATFNGNRPDYEAAIKQRNQYQNDYKRMK